MKILNTFSKSGIAIYLIIGLLASSCSHEIKPEKMDVNPIEGTWKMTYGEIRENDSIKIKDLSNTDFIKIINESHFSFFNQERGTQENFTAGAGTYTFDGSKYVENLNFINYMDYRGQSFSFELEIKGDSMIQHGHEKLEASGVDRYIVEKYVRIKN